MKKTISFILMLASIQSVFSQEITDGSFLGKWCGQWDGIYPVCITINSIKENAITHYEWVENEGEAFKQSEKKLIRINRNTLKLDNVFFALDENNLGSANAMGIFVIQTRVAVLKKQISISGI